MSPVIRAFCLCSRCQSSQFGTTNGNPDMFFWIQTWEIKCLLLNIHPLSDHLCESEDCNPGIKIGLWGVSHWTLFAKFCIQYIVSWVISSWEHVLNDAFFLDDSSVSDDICASLAVVMFSESIIWVQNYRTIHRVLLKGWRRVMPEKSRVSISSTTRTTSVLWTRASKQIGNRGLSPPLSVPDARDVLGSLYVDLCSSCWQSSTWESLSNRRCPFWSPLCC